MHHAASSAPPRGRILSWCALPFSDDTHEAPAAAPMGG